MRVDPICRIHRTFVVIGTAQHDACSAVIEHKAFRTIDDQLIEIGAFRLAVADIEVTALVVILKHVVHNASNGIGSVESRGSVPKHFKSINAGYRNRVGIGGYHRDAILCLSAGV